MNKEKEKKTNFLRKNALFLILALCVLAVGLSVTLMLITNDNSSVQVSTPVVENPTDPADPSEPTDPADPTDPSDPTDPATETVTFIMPVANATSIGAYTETMVFNSTLSRFSAHLAIDFFAPEGTDVLAVYGGKVESVENGLLTGVTITIDHGNNLKTVYNSLADGEAVTVGQTVAQGDVIGKVSTTNRQEYKDGAHLHFEVIEDGETINPSKYLVFEEK